MGSGLAKLWMHLPSTQSDNDTNMAPLTGLVFITLRTKRNTKARGNAQAFVKSNKYILKERQ